MRRKYFIRGMGIGIIITSLVFMGLMFFRGNGNTMTDAQIRQRALELGMVYADKTIAEDQEKPGDKEENTSDTEENAPDMEEDIPDTEENALEENAEVTTEELTGDEVEAAPNQSSTPTSPQSPQTSATTSPQSPQTPQSPVTNASDSENSTTNTGNTNTGSSTLTGTNIKTFVIRSGDSSSRVGANLYAAGLVEDPVAFDRYLENNGYDKNIQVGTYQIRQGASFESIAKTITRSGN